MCRQIDENNYIEWGDPDLQEQMPSYSLSYMDLSFDSLELFIQREGPLETRKILGQWGRNILKQMGW